MLHPFDGELAGVTSLFLLVEVVLTVAALAASRPSIRRRIVVGASALLAAYLSLYGLAWWWAEQWRSLR